MCRLKRMGIILSATLVFSAFAPLTATADEVRIAGDVTGDGVVNLYDAIETASCIMNDNNFTEEQLGVADYNADGHINLYDVIDIAKLIMEDKETWQSAYLNVIEEECAIPDSMEYSLICIDDNEIPELIMHHADVGGVYTYFDGEAKWIASLSMRSDFNGYIEKANIFSIYSYISLPENELDEYYEFYELRNGSMSHIETARKNGSAAYLINDEIVTEEEFNERLAQYQPMETEFEKYSYDEIKEILSE